MYTSNISANININNDPFNYRIGPSQVKSSQVPFVIYYFFALTYLHRIFTTARTEMALKICSYFLRQTSRVFPNVLLPEVNNVVR